MNAVPKKYDEAFKRQAVEMVLHGGKTVKQVADELGVSPYSIYEWKRQAFPLGAPGGARRQNVGARRAVGRGGKTPSTHSGATASDRRVDPTAGDSKKNAGYCLRGALERYERIEEMKQDYPIEVLCEAFCVSRSGFYEWRGRPTHPSVRASQDRELAEQIREVHQQSRGTYGTPRLHAELRERGHRHSRKRIDRIRRELGLSAAARSGVTGHAPPTAIMPSRLRLIAWPSCRRPPDAIRSGESDITYIPTE